MYTTWSRSLVATVGRLEIYERGRRKYKLIGDRSLLPLLFLRNILYESVLYIPSLISAGSEYIVSSHSTKFKATCAFHPLYLPLARQLWPLLHQLRRNERAHWSYGE